MLKRLGLVACAVMLMVSSDASACNLLGIFGCGGGNRGCGFRSVPCGALCGVQRVGTVSYSSGTVAYPSYPVIPATYAVPCQNGRCPVPVVPTTIPVTPAGTVFPPVPLPDNPPKIAPTGIPDKPEPKVAPK